MSRLMLCAGTAKREGWKTLDTSVKGNPDYWSRVPPLPRAVADQKWDEIELIHGITSFYPWEAKQLLIEVRDVLAPGGKLVLEQPDLQCVIQSLYIGKGGASIEWLFGDPKFKNPEHMNKWAYDLGSLRGLVLECGFTTIDAEQPAQHHDPKRDFRMEAWK